MNKKRSNFYHNLDIYLVAICKKERSNKVVFNKLNSKIESLNAEFQNLANKKVCKNYLIQRMKKSQQF